MIFSSADMLLATNKNKQNTYHNSGKSILHFLCSVIRDIAGSVLKVKSIRSFCARFTTIIYVIIWWVNQIFSSIFSHIDFFR